MQQFRVRIQKRFIQSYCSLSKVLHYLRKAYPFMFLHLCSPAWGSSFRQYRVHENNNLKGLIVIGTGVTDVPIIA